MKVAVLMGSDSDLPRLEGCLAALRELAAEQVGEGGGVRRTSGGAHAAVLAGRFHFYEGRSMDPHTREKLREFYEPYTERLYRMMEQIGKDGDDMKFKQSLTSASTTAPDFIAGQQLCVVKQDPPA